ncbi:hypothetical protein HON71_01840 [Candidatus Woesearchaeota archaeon]|nr:hypothetical protein [Candidatus Woesearchaeota archaeon]MBT5342726.1 hypothetical protein [Candidatus Woesearchaeota archaeon]
MGDPNLVLGFDISKSNRYKKDCKKYNDLIKRIISTELKIVGYPEKSRVLHGPFTGKKCKGLLHAYVGENMRILYKPDYKNKIVFLKRFLTHTQMEQKCN